MKNWNCYKGEKKKSFFYLMQESTEVYNTSETQRGKCKMSKATQNMVKDQNWYKKKKEERKQSETGRRCKSRDPDVTRLCVSQWLRACIHAEFDGKWKFTWHPGPSWHEPEQSNTDRVRRAEDEAVLEDTPGRHVLHARLTWRSATAAWQKMLIGSVCGEGSICLLMSVTFTIFHCSETVQIMPVSLKHR